MQDRPDWMPSQGKDLKEASHELETFAAYMENRSEISEPSTAPPSARDYGGNQGQQVPAQATRADANWSRPICPVSTPALRCSGLGHHGRPGCGSQRMESPEVGGGGISFSADAVGPPALPADGPADSPSMHGNGGDIAQKAKLWD